MYKMYGYSIKTNSKMEILFVYNMHTRETTVAWMFTEYDVAQGILNTEISM